jgi:hypothetical protein
VSRKADVEVTGLTGLVRELKGPLFKDLNRELRQFSKLIAADLVPHVEAAVRQSGAPQADAMARTVRVHSDRVPVVVVGKVNPRFRGSRFRGGNTKKRRGALAHGVVYGPKGGRKDTPADENYYAPQRRDDSGGALGRSVKSGPIWDEATAAYLKYFQAAATHHGFIKSGRSVRWGGGH